MQDKDTKQPEDYKDALDALQEWTRKNWWKTGSCTKENATTGSIDRPFPSKQSQQNPIKPRKKKGRGYKK